MSNNNQSRFPKLRKLRFKEMCKNCVFQDCKCKCSQCGVVGVDKVHGTRYCKCYARAGAKEVKCYYYRKARQCKQ